VSERSIWRACLFESIRSSVHLAHNHRTPQTFPNERSSHWRLAATSSPSSLLPPAGSFPFVVSSCLSSLLHYCSLRILLLILYERRFLVSSRLEQSFFSVLKGNISSQVSWRRQNLSVYQFQITRRCCSKHWLRKKSID
jgi:hypothetical protein